MSERDTLDIDVVFVGAGPASLAGAYRLAQLIKRHNAQVPASEGIEASIAVLEKGKEIGSHALSGAVLDPRSLKALFPERWTEAPFESAVSGERFLFLSRRRAWPLPIPPPLNNHGNYVVSLGKLLKWMAPLVEAEGVDIFCEFPAVAPLIEDERVVGVRTGDRGRDRGGAPKPNFEAGIDIRCQVVVLGEGPRGTLARQLESRFDLTAGRNPQVYALGLKEVWELPPGRLAPGEVIHTLGWPLDFQSFGGGFVYMMRDQQAIVGFVAGLDYRDPRFDPHTAFQRFKTHPAIARLLDGGKMTFYGGKALPEGGWFSMPRLYGDGFLLIGDSGGFLNSQRLKGIHLAIESGVLAAESVFEALRTGNSSAATLKSYARRVADGAVATELRRVRNFHQAFEHGTIAGLAQAALGLVTGGRGFGLFDRLRASAGHQRLRPLPASGPLPAPFAPDGRFTFDKLHDVYNSATAHEEDQPSHLLVADTAICVGRCAEEFGNPCQRFCPAAVYEIVADPTAAAGKRLQINASNCIHCKTCDIMDPYQIITWVPPEGGGGPNYGKM